MSFGCRSLSVPNSAPRRLPDATDPHRQREGNGYAEQGRGRCAARRHLLPPVGGGRGQGRPRAGQPQHPEPEVHAGTVRGRARLADIQYLQRRRLYGQRQGTPPVQPFAGGCAQGLLRHRAVQSQSRFTREMELVENTSTACSWNGAYALWAMPTTPTPQIVATKRPGRSTGW